MKAVDLFAGAGGLSLGAQNAGLQLAFAVEKDSFAAETYAKNFPKATMIKSDVEEFSLVPLASGTIDVVLAGPPCQAFSTSNQRTRNSSNPLNKLLFEPVRVIAELEPRVAFLENVGGLLIGTRRAYLESLLGQLSHVGYHYKVLLVDSARVGVPQKRSRLFVIASRSALKDIRIVETGARLTVRHAIADLPMLVNGSDNNVLPYYTPPASAYAQALRAELASCSGHLVTKNADAVLRRYAYIPQGGNWRSIPSEEMLNYKNVNRCHTGIYHRLSWDAPSKVIGNFRKNMLIHPEQHRGLSVREAARLQSFPDWFDFVGSIGKQQQQVGNAVPPAMASAVVTAGLEAAGLR